MRAEPAFQAGSQPAWMDGADETAEPAILGRPSRRTTRMLPNSMAQVACSDTRAGVACMLIANDATAKGGGSSGGQSACMETPGNLFCVAAPSGAGKSSLVKALLEIDSRLAVSVSHTTRAPRGQEVHGREYWFVDEPAFRAMIGRNEFFEWAQVHGKLYGTSRKAVEERLVRGDDVVLEIDWQGALQIKQLFAHAVLIFILPPSWEELEQRLRRRGEDLPATIAQRLANARDEVAQACHFDFVIINSLFESALFDLKTVVHSQRLRYAAQRRARSLVFAALGLA